MSDEKRQDGEGMGLISRRKAIGLIGATGLMLVVGCGDDDGSGAGDPTATQFDPTTTESGASATPTAAVTTAPAVACVVTPEVTEGPYFVDERLNRSDITTDPDTGAVSDGVPLTVNLVVSSVTGGVCTPLADALIDMWHCDAAGEYSDISGGAGQSNTSGLKFLRGYQVTDGNGGVTFQTIYPGWYSGRTIHIHYKVRTDPDSNQGLEFTSQIFFDEAVTDAVMARSPYNEKGSPDQRNATDNIYDERLLMQLTEQGDGYTGTLHIGAEA